MKHNSLNEDIPIAIAFKAFGITSDQEIVQTIGLEDFIIEALTPCLYEAHAAQVYTQLQAWNYIGSRVKTTIKRFDDSRKKTKTQEGRDILFKIILAHVPVVENSLKMKAIYMAVMLRRTIMAKIGKISQDDRDYYGNKRLELAGQLISLLFEDLFKRFNSEVSLPEIMVSPSSPKLSLFLSKLQSIAEKTIPRQRAAQFDIVKHIRQDLITNGLATAISSVTHTFFGHCGQTT